MPFQVAFDELSNFYSTGNITLSVETTGSDTPTTRPRYISGGDYSSDPFLTIQAAIDSIPEPKNIDPSHTVVINVGVGDFDGFVLVGKTLATEFLGIFPDHYRIVGTRINSTIATGLTSGTFTSATSYTVTLTGAGWTASDLKGRYIEVTAGTGSGQILVITDNTAEVITFGGKPGTTLDATSQFTIVEPGSVITSGGSLFAGIEVQSNVGQITLQDLMLHPGTAYGILQIQSRGRILAIRCSSRNNINSFVVSEGSERIELEECYGSNTGQFLLADSTATIVVKNCGTKRSGGARAINVFSALRMTIDGFTAIGSYSIAAVSVSSTQRAAFENVKVDGAARAISLETVLAAYLFGENDFSNLTINAFDFFFSNLWIDSTTPLAGTGNAGFGVYVDAPASTVELYNGVPTITGSSGDASVDGTTALDWSTDFATVGDSVVNVATGARIVRTS